MPSPNDLNGASALNSCPEIDRLVTPVFLRGHTSSSHQIAFYINSLNISAFERAFSYHRTLFTPFIFISAGKL